MTEVSLDVAGISVSEDGRTLRIGLRKDDKVVLDWLLEASRLEAFMAMLSAAASDAAGRRNDDPNILHILPHERWELLRHPEEGLLLTFQIALGLELTFQIRPDAVSRFVETVNAIARPESVSIPANIVRN